MALSVLNITDLRSIESAALEFSPGHNLIVGPNGSGKTSLLEAIFLLGRGRSFRSRNNDRLIRQGQAALVVFGKVAPEAGASASSLTHAIGVEVSRAQGTRGRIDATDVGSLAELSLRFPVQVIDPGIHKLLEEGGQRRRRWLDWLVFHVEPMYVDKWSRYMRALRQRNGALRAGSPDIGSWDVELARLGEQVVAARTGVLDRLRPLCQALAHRLTGLDLEFVHAKGWAGDASLADALRETLPRYRIRQVTHAGPHRADVQVRIAGRFARERLSRGQQKLVAAAMSLAQVAMLRAELGVRPTLLLDDPGAELDPAALSRFITEVRALAGQLVVTTLDAESYPLGAPDRLFHVEHGAIRTADGRAGDLHLRVGLGPSDTL